MLEAVVPYACCCFNPAAFSPVKTSIGNVYNIDVDVAADNATTEFSPEPSFEETFASLSPQGAWTSSMTMSKGMSHDFRVCGINSKRNGGGWSRPLKLLTDSGNRSETPLGSV
jgi:hypothetical protein